jgi:hypothetical protein
MSNGSYLRKDGKVIFSSLSKVFMNVNKDDHSMDVRIEGQPLIEASFDAEMISKFAVNGEVKTPKYGKDKMLLISIDKTK